MSKQVVRFSVRVQLEQVVGVGGVDAVVVEWKRGKHHGVSPAAPVKGTSAVWGEHEILIPCTMYFQPKKRAFEEKSLSLVLCRAAGSKPLGRAAVPLDVLAADVGDAAVKSFKRKEVLDGVVELEFSVTLKRLLDPRDKVGGALLGSSSPMPVRTSGGSTSGTPVLTRAAVLAEEQQQQPKLALSESPLQSLEVGRAGPSLEPAANTSPPPLLAAPSGTTARKVAALQLTPTLSTSEQPFGPPPTGVASHVRGEKEFGYASSGGIPLSARSHERTGSSTPTPLSPLTLGAPSGHARGGSAVHHRPAAGSATSDQASSPGLLQRSSEFDVSGIAGGAGGGGGGGGSSKPSKKSILGGAGHRRGKSHAVTPEELRGLASGGDLRQQPQFAMAPSSLNSSGASRKSNASKVATKLGFVSKTRADSRGSVSSASTPLSPRVMDGSDSGGMRRSASNTPDFLLVGSAGSSSSSSSDFEEELISSSSGAARPAAFGGSSNSSVGSGGSPSRSGSGLMVSPASPLSSSSVGGGGGGGGGVGNSSPVVSKSSAEHREQIEFYQRQLADHGRRRDQSYVLQHFVAFCQPAYSKGMPISAWVLFRCLAEWDCFSNNDGREFREQLLDGFEQLTKNVMDQHHQLYWMSTLLALLHLLRNKLRPLPRSDVQRNTALTVFQERLRGLASALCARAAAHAIGELRPMVSPALLEHALLEDAAAGPRTAAAAAKSPSVHQSLPPPPPPPQVKVTLASIIVLLEHLRNALASAFVSPGVSTQIMARVAHGVTAVALNTLLDNNPRLCTFSNGLQMKKPVLELKSWLAKHQLESAAAELEPLEEVVNVLCMNKSALVEAEVRREVCPHLSAAQLGQLLLLYTPDSFDSEPVHPAVLAALCGDAPLEYRMEVEQRAPFVLDAAGAGAAGAEGADPELPKAAAEQPSLAFLARPYAHDDAMSDAW
jgi:hypothetical protein